ncbi:MAG: Ig-like domain-containing protein, partial [Prevotella sp.]|nr:Ig-like domain-containing protein [Prevotella sp.]
TCKVTVNNLSPTAVALPNTATVAIGSSIALKPEFTPSNALAELTWSSDDESIAVVSNNGVVTGKKKGQTFINVETDNGKTAYCKLTVTAPEPVSIELPKTATVIVGGT